MSRYADLTALQRLPRARVAVRAAAVSTRGGRSTTTVTIQNISRANSVSFFVRADIRRGTRSGHELPGDNEILPIFWSDNDISLWPGESQTLTATYPAAALRGSAPVVSVYGWNVPRLDAAAPTR